MPGLSTTTPRESLFVDPPPRAWGGLVGPRAGGEFSSAPARREVRRALGLPERGTLIMTGHQAEFWHPGILAKYLAAESARCALQRRAVEAHTAWIVVDQDANDPGVIRYPAIADRDGRRCLEPRAWRSEYEGAEPEAGVAIADRPRLQPGPLPRDAALSCVGDGLRRISESLIAPGGDSAAGQVAAAGDALLARIGLRAPTLLATALASTPLFRALLQRMLRDPGACIDAYNAAVRAVPDAGVTELYCDAVQYRYELPLWVLERGRPRRRAFVEDIEAGDLRLAPRALFMTAILRLAVCDLFVHGVGGGVYDRVTERWLSAWLPGETLALTALVTATRFLPFDLPPPADAAGAVWAAHHARHDPAMLGEDGAAARKRELVEAIRRAKGTKGAHALFRDMHALLGTVRAHHRAELAALEHAVAESRAREADRRVAHERAWAWPLYPPDAIASLAAEIDAAFAG